MRIADFRQLYELVLPHLPLRDEPRCAYGWDEILLVVIKVLAEGCTFETAARFLDFSGKSFVERYFDVVLLAIIKAVASTRGQGEDLNCSINFPEGEELEAEKRRWVSGRNPEDQRFAAFSGCCGAGDGTLIPVLVKDDPSFTIAAHRTRKGGTMPNQNHETYSTTSLSLPFAYCRWHDLLQLHGRSWCTPQFHVLRCRGGRLCPRRTPHRLCQIARTAALKLLHSF